MVSTAYVQRDYRGVHADVSALLELGLLARNDQGRILVGWDRIVAEMDLTQAA